MKGRLHGEFKTDMYSDGVRKAREEGWMEQALAQTTVGSTDEQDERTALLYGYRWSTARPAPIESAYTQSSVCSGSVLCELARFAGTQAGCST